VKTEEPEKKDKNPQRKEGLRQYQGRTKPASVSTRKVSNRERVLSAYLSIKEEKKNRQKPKKKGKSGGGAQQLRGSAEKVFPEHKPNRLRRKEEGKKNQHRGGRGGWGNELTTEEKKKRLVKNTASANPKSGSVLFRVN